LNNAKRLLFFRIAATGRRLTGAAQLQNFASQGFRVAAYSKI